MDREDYVCDMCDSEFTVEHSENNTAAFCPFCGEQLFDDEVEEEFDGETWDDE